MGVTLFNCNSICYSIESHVVSVTTVILMSNTCIGLNSSLHFDVANLDVKHVVQLEYFTALWPSNTGFTREFSYSKIERNYTMLYFFVVEFCGWFCCCLSESVHKRCVENIYTKYVLCRCYSEGPLSNIVECLMLGSI